MSLEETKRKFIISNEMKRAVNVLLNCVWNRLWIKNSWSKKYIAQ